MELPGISAEVAPGRTFNAYSLNGYNFSGTIGTTARATMFSYALDGSGPSVFGITNYLRADCPGQTADGPGYTGANELRVVVWTAPGYNASIALFEN